MKIALILGVIVGLIAWTDPRCDSDDSIFAGFCAAGIGIILVLILSVSCSNISNFITTTEYDYNLIPFEENIYVRQTTHNGNDVYTFMTHDINTGPIEIIEKKIGNCPCIGYSQVKDEKIKYPHYVHWDIDYNNNFMKTFLWDFNCDKYILIIPDGSIQNISN